MSLKHGYKTTEFWLTVLPIALGLIDALFGTELYRPEMFGGAGAYAVGRSIAKRVR